MSSDKWQYSTGGAFNDFTEYGAPTDNTWYRVRIDFCTSGTYLNLSAHQFQISVDDSFSNIYSFSSSFDDIRKIRFTSSSSDQGSAWLDAIGLTWDDLYCLGDNKYSVVSYPEKTNVRFVADCTDTESDIPSLRYFWNFGDHQAITPTPITTYSYNLPSVYNVTLTVIDSENFNTSYSSIVWVRVTTFLTLSIRYWSSPQGFVINVTGKLHDKLGTALQNETVVLYSNEAELASQKTDKQGKQDK